LLIIPETVSDAALSTLKGVTDQESGRSPGAGHTTGRIDPAAAEDWRLISASLFCLSES